MASATSASRNQISSRRSLPRARIHSASSVTFVGILDDDGLHEVVLAGQEELTTRLRGGDGGGRHQRGDVTDGVGAQVVVAEVLAHAAPARSAGRTRRRGRRRRTTPAPAGDGRRSRRRAHRRRWPPGLGRTGRCGPRCRCRRRARCRRAARARGLAEVVVVDEDLERALAVGWSYSAPGVSKPWAPSRSATSGPRPWGRRGTRLGIDEAADEPRAGDPVGLGSGAGDPLHGCASVVGNVGSGDAAPG